jgi:hypothetical protein
LDEGIDRSSGAGVVSNRSNNENRPMHSSTPVCDRKFGQMWMSAEKRALLKEIGLGQHDLRKQLFPLVLLAAPKYSIYGVQQLPRNRNERL